MEKNYSAYWFAWSAIDPLYGLSELAGCMNRKPVVEVILLSHVAMVVSKQHHDVTETLPISINNIDCKEANAAHSKTSEASHPPQRDCRKTNTTL